MMANSWLHRDTKIKQLKLLEGRGGGKEHINYMIKSISFSKFETCYDKIVLWKKTLSKHLWGQLIKQTTARMSSHCSTLESTALSCHDDS